MMMSRKIGMGDVAYVSFRPVVWLIDAVWGTDMAECEKCAARRKKWNSKGEVPVPVVILVVTIAVSFFVWRTF